MGKSVMKVKKTPLVPLLHLEEPGAFVPVGDDNGEFGTVPAGGSAGQVLTKSSNNDYDVEWDEASSLPDITEGDIGKVLTVIDDDDTPSTGWVDPKASVMPAGGNAGDILIKRAGEDYAYGWGPFPAVRVRATALNVGKSETHRFTAPSGTSSVEVPILDPADIENPFSELGNTKNLPTLFLVKGVLHTKNVADTDYSATNLMCVLYWIGFYTHEGTNPIGTSYNRMCASLGKLIPVSKISVSESYSDYMKPNTTFIEATPTLNLYGDWEDTPQAFPNQEVGEGIFDPQGKKISIYANSDMTGGENYDYYWDYYIYF